MAQGGECRKSAVQQRIEEKLQASFSPSRLTLIDKSCGCGAAFDCVVVSNSFQGQDPLSRHRAVNKAIAEEIASIHAFSLKCYTPEEAPEEPSANS